MRQQSGRAGKISEAGQCSRAIYNIGDNYAASIKGLANTLDDAVKGNIRERIVRNGLWIADGSEGRFELICEKEPVLRPPTAEDIAASPSKNVVITTIPCASDVHLYSRTARHRIVYGRLLRAVNLKVDDGSYSPTNPFALSIMGGGESGSPEVFLEQGRLGQVSCKYLGTDKFNETVTEVVEVIRDELKARWYLDVNRGAVPRRIQFFDAENNIRGETLVTDVRRCDNGGFLSERAVVTWNNPGSLNVEIIELVSQDISKPKRESLALRVPAGTAIIDVRNGRSSYRIDKEQSLHIDDFQKLLEVSAKKLAEREAGLRSK